MNWAINTKYYPGIPHFVALQTLHFLKLKVSGNPALSKSIGTIFPKAFTHFVSLCHIFTILTKFQTFSSLLYLLQWSMISDLWCTIVVVLGCHSPRLYEVANLINTLCSVCSTDQLFQHLFSSPLASLLLRHNNIKIRPVNNSTMAS